MKKIIGKKYYRIVFRNTSPLSIGKGESELTDQDILLDSSGKPYIPGSALAGVYRSMFEAENKETANTYFGYVEMPKGKEEEQQSIESLLMIYDAVMPLGIEQNIHIVSRDMVALDEYKTAKDGAKFDFQVLEPGVQFVTYIEQNITKECDKDGKKETSLYHEDIAGKIAKAFCEGKLHIGSKTTRGFGRVKAEEIHVAEFSFEKENAGETSYGVEEWLDFSMYENPEKPSSCWGKVNQDDRRLPELNDEMNRLHITMELKQAGGISIRRYSTKENEADYEQLTIRKSEMKDGSIQLTEVPVIPGTSWAGAFHAQMLKLYSAYDTVENAAQELKLFFGDVKGKKEKAADGEASGKAYYKSRISFEESQIDDAREATYTRNAIDRFSGAAADSALYTEKTWFDGKTKLEIVYDNLTAYAADSEEGKRQKRFLQTLAAAITDLKEGYMAVGGLTAVGRGLFTCEKITLQCGNQSAVTKELKNNQIVEEDAGSSRVSNEMDSVYQWLVTEFDNMAKMQNDESEQ